MIKIIKNKDIKLNIPKFLCDENAVGKHLNEHPLTELLNVYGFTCLIGRPASGKTSFAISMITNPKIYKKAAHHVLVLMPQTSINSLVKNPFQCLQSENIYNELDDDSMNDIITRIDEYSNNDEKTLLFIDDFTADLKKSAFIILTLKKLIYNRRHLKLNIIITAQSYVNMPLDIRKSIQNLVLFKPSKREFEIVFNELIESHKDKFLDVLKITYDEPHNFLFLNVPSQRMFKNFDELIIKEDE